MSEKLKLKINLKRKRKMDYRIEETIKWFEKFRMDVYWEGLN